MNETTQDILRVALKEPNRIVTLSFACLNIGSLIKPAFRKMLIEFESSGGVFSNRSEYPGWIETTYIDPKFTGEAQLVYRVYQYIQMLMEDD